MKKYLNFSYLCFLFVAFSVLGVEVKELKTSQDGRKRRKALEKLVIARVRKDYVRFTFQELDKIEKLYQVANLKSHSWEAKEALEKLISMRYYSVVNRMGCAYLYLGTMEIIEEWKKIDYLKTAIDEYGNCWYGDSVQVGPYARYVLAKIYFKNGENEKANILFDEILKKYPDAIDHRGNLLKDKIYKYFLNE